MEVKDEGHACGERSLAAGLVRGQETGQDQCHDMGDNAHEELMLITEESELNLAGDEMTWVVDSRGSFHLTPDRKCFSSYSAGDQGCVRMGNEGTY